MMDLKNSFTGNEVAKYIEKNKDKNFIILSNRDNFISCGISGIGIHEKIITGQIIPKKYFPEFITLYKSIGEEETIVVGLESTKGIPDCPGGLFFKKEYEDENLE